jgi:spermidine/putrescine transport system substrate-binding protein
VLGGLAASLIAAPALAQRQQQRQQRPQEQGEPKRLRIFNWDDHLTDQTLEAFARATGIDIEYDYYRSNEEMLEALVDGPPVHDLVMPSDYMVDLLHKRHLIQRIDHRRLPNLKHLIQAKPFQDPPYNPGLRWGVPHLWGSAGIGFRRSRTGQAPSSWKTLYDSDRHKGRIALPGDPQVLLGCAAKYLGHRLTRSTRSRSDACATWCCARSRTCGSSRPAARRTCCWSTTSTWGSAGAATSFR